MRLTDHDASFLTSETADTPMHGVGISIIEGVIGFDEVFDQIAARIHQIPRYRQKLAFVPLNLAQPVWVDDAQFDLQNHVQELRVKRGTHIEGAFEEILSAAETLLPRDRPLWLIYVVKGVKGVTLLAHFAHHAMVDGASGVDISQILFDIQPNPKRPDASPDWQPQKSPDPAALAMQALQENTQMFAQRARNMGSFDSGNAELVRRATESVTRFISEPVMSAPWNRGVVQRGRVFRYRKYDFASIRKIRNALGGTVNDVVLAIVVEAAARYAEAADKHSTGRHLRVMCPVNVRREGEQGVLSNRVSGIFPVFKADPGDAVERLKEVRWETENIKQNREAQALQLLSELMPPMPPSVNKDDGLFGLAGLNLATFNPLALLSQFGPPILPSYVANLPMAGFNFTCSNVPGVQTTQYFAGRKVVDQLAVLMLAANLGYGTAILSYDQSLYFNLVSDPKLMPDIDVMADLIDAVFNELQAAAQGAA